MEKKAYITWIDKDKHNNSDKLSCEHTKIMGIGNILKVWELKGVGLGRRVFEADKKSEKFTNPDLAYPYYFTAAPLKIIKCSPTFEKKIITVHFKPFDHEIYVSNWLNNTKSFYCYKKSNFVFYSFEGGNWEIQKALRVSDTQTYRLKSTILRHHPIFGHYSWKELLAKF